MNEVEKETARQKEREKKWIENETNSRRKQQYVRMYSGTRGLGDSGISRGAMKTVETRGD